MNNRPNILFVVIDALRARHLGCYGNPQSISQNIDKLAEEGILFEDAYACTNITDSSLTTIFSGRYPLAHGIISHGNQVLEEQINRLKKTPLLPEILSSEGYATTAVDWIDRWHKRGYQIYTGKINKEKRRFFRILGAISRKYARIDKSTLIDEAHIITNEAIKTIKKFHNKPFFLFLHYWDLHSRYAPPVKYYKHIKKQPLRLNTATLMRALRRPVKAFMLPENITRYNASIAFVDHQIGRLINYLERHNILKNTIMILTSDHGESLGEHGIYYTHHGLYDVNLHVPLVIRYPKLPAGKRIKGFVQHFDIVPTILEMLEIKMNVNFDGKSLIPLIDDRLRQLHSEVYFEEAYLQRKRGIRTENYKYIYALSRKGAVCRECRCIHGGFEELYDLKKDPEENQNIITQRPEIAFELRNTLMKRLEILKRR